MGDGTLCGSYWIRGVPPAKLDAASTARMEERATHQLSRLRRRSARSASLGDSLSVDSGSDISWDYRRRHTFTTAIPPHSPPIADANAHSEDSNRDRVSTLMGLPGLSDTACVRSCRPGSTSGRSGIEAPYCRANSASTALRASMSPFAATRRPSFAPPSIPSAASSAAALRASTGFRIAAARVSAVRGSCPVFAAAGDSGLQEVPRLVMSDRSRPGSSLPSGQYWRGITRVAERARDANTGE